MPWMKEKHYQMEQLYSDDNSIDMFVYGGTAYLNAADVDWIKNEIFEKEKCSRKINSFKITKDFQKINISAGAAGTVGFLNIF